MSNEERLVIRELHFQYSRSYPSSVILEIQGSSVLNLRKRFSVVARFFTFNTRTQVETGDSFTIPTSILINPTEVLINSKLILETLSKTDRCSNEALRKKFPSGREYKPWKRETPDIEHKIVMYRTLRRKAMDGNISETELQMLVRKNIERRVKSTRKFTLKCNFVPKKSPLCQVNLPEEEDSEDNQANTSIITVPLYSNSHLINVKTHLLNRSAEVIDGLKIVDLRSKTEKRLQSSENKGEEHSIIAINDPTIKKQVNEPMLFQQMIPSFINVFISLMARKCAK